MTSGFRYSPDPGAVLGAPWNITFISQRDVGLRVPFNYVTHPSISITAACFGSRRYEDYAAAKCISNLLAVGFQRIHLDLYWDVGRRIWSFCPVSLPTAEGISRSETIAVALDAFSNSTIMPSSASLPSPTTLAASSPALVEVAAAKHRRQFNPFDPDLTSTPAFTSSTSSITKATLTVNLATSDNTAFAALPTSIPKNTQEILYSIGDYTCSGTSAIEILTALLPSFLTVTDDTLHAAMQYVIFNIHASAPIAAPDAPAARPAQADLPSSDELIGQYFLSNASTFLFTPTLLQKERANLSMSWFDSDYSSAEPLASYYANIDTNANGMLASTTDGWPSSSFTLFRRENHYRLVFGFGSVDPQMEGYNFTGDGQIVFPPGYIDDVRETSQSSTGSISQGCLYDPTNTSVSASNNSFALGTISSDAITSEQAQIVALDYNQTLPSISNLTNCGLSPFLNTTLNGTSADINFEPYRAVAFSATWSWSWGEPRTADRALSLEDGGPNPATHERCAVMDPTIPGGRWRVVHCTDSYYGACRIGGAPLEWAISSSAANYSMVPQSCPSNSSFGVPRTAMENRYLLAAYQRSASAGIVNGTAPLYIDFNSLDVPSCWVSGVNSTCPYDISTDDAANIYIPTVAGVVILVLTVLLIVIKCGANRAHSRRRRKRGTDGWDYEGVPS